MNIKILKFGLFDAIFWGFCASYCGFITSYLLAEGMNRTILSIDIAVYMIIAFVAAIFWGRRCDRLHSNKKVFIPEFILTFLLALVVFAIAKTNIQITSFIYPLIAFAVFPLGSNMDAWMLRYLDHDTAAYSKARAMGSVGYAVPMLFCGQLINMFGYPAMIITASVYACITMVIAVFMAEQKEIEVIHTEKKQSFRRLFSNKKYAMMLVIVFLTGLAVAPMNNLKIVFLQEVGGNVSSLGIDSFIGVGCQALFICLSGNMHRVPAKMRLLLMSICMMAAMFFTMMAHSPMLVILGTAVSNSSFGIMLPTVREITQKEVDAAQVNTAYSLSDATYSSAAAVAAMSYSGFLIDALGTKSVCVLGLGITILATLLITIQLLGKEQKHALRISLAYEQK